MNKYCTTWVQNWCHEHGWTDLFMERRMYWAFPPHAVIPLPIPDDALRRIKTQYGLSPQEKLWCAAAWAIGGLGVALTWWLECPIPLVAAFAFCAVTVALLEDE